jgi:nucleoid-associated protein
MNILEATLHRIEKSKNTSGPGSAQLSLRSERLPLDQKLNRVVTDILRIYAKSISGYGTFNTNQTVYRFTEFLTGYVVNEGEFIDFTQETTHLIAAKMEGEGFSTGGYALFLRYENQERDWLLVAMLKLKPGTGVNESTIELSDTLSFDIDHLHEAARIDLEKWQDNDQPYLSFIKKRQNGQDVSHYFREALGCTEYTDSKHNTEKMREAFESYIEKQSWTPEKKREGRRKVYDYCESKNKDGEPVNLTSLSAIVNDQDPESFAAYVREEGYEVGETFKPHKATYTRFKRIQRQFGSVKVSFDVQDLLDGRVDYDDSIECLVIADFPAELIEEIKKHKESQNEPATI